MSLLSLLFSHNKFNVLFENKPDIIEIFSSILALLVSLQIWIGLSSITMYQVDGISMPSIYFAIAFLVMGIVQWNGWYTDKWWLRRLSSFSNMGVWLFFAITVTLGYPRDPHGIAFFVPFLANLWVYLRLGLIEDGN